MRCHDQEPLCETQAAWPTPGNQQFTIQSGPRCTESQQRLPRSQPTHPSSHHVELWRHFGRSNTLHTPTPLSFSLGPTMLFYSFKIPIILKAQLKCHFFCKSNPNPCQNEYPSSQLLPRAGMVSGVALFFTTCLHGQVKHSMRCYTLVICWGFPVLNTLSQTE